MEIQLKNIKHSSFASHETHCFEASVYINGKKAGIVENDGNGGPDFFHPHHLRDEINAYAKTLPPIDFCGKKLPQDAEILIGKLVNQWLDRRYLTRLCSKQTLFRKPGQSYKEGEYTTLTGKYTPRHKEYLVKKYGPDVFILNETI